ncbi:MAG: tail fiber protein [Pseudomonadota bacterium]
MDPWIGEIRHFSFPFAPRGWVPCDGRLLPVRQNAALYSLLGTSFGGDGINNFEVPDLRGRAIVGATQLTQPATPPYVIGEVAGVEVVTLTVNHMPRHAHDVRVATTSDNQALPKGSYFAPVSQFKTFPTIPVYGTPTAQAVPLSPATVTAAGGGVHSNMQPYAVVEYCMAISGLYPGRD